MDHNKIIERLHAIGITGVKAAHCFALLDEISRGDTAPLMENVARVDRRLSRITVAVRIAVETILGQIEATPKAPIEITALIVEHLRDAMRDES